MEIKTKQYSKTSSIPIGSNILNRPRIDNLLEECVQHHFSIVSAGAGFGKTVAVASFIERSDYRGVWQQLTLLDNLPMRFWESFIHTVSVHRPKLAEKLGELGFPDSLYSFHRFLQLLTEELYVDNQFVVMVFDDFHLINDQSILEFFKLLVSANLENICMMFVTRDSGIETIPSSAFGVFTEDLRFTKDESRAYYEMLGVNIQNESEIDRIFDYTKGWPAALSLIGTQFHKNDFGVDKNIIDSQNIFFKLIDKEIFSNYSEDEKNFFILLSFLNFFPSELLNEIMGHSNAMTLLRENAFVSYEANSKSYYLHQIFLDFLLEKQGSIEQSSIVELYHKAGDWCRKNKYYIDAITYYEKCGAEDMMAEVIQGFEGLRFSRKDADLFIKYIENFSDEFIRKNVMCRIVYAMLFINNLEVKKALEQIEIVLMQLEVNRNDTENKFLLGEANIAAGLIDLCLGNKDFVKLFKEADEVLDSGTGHWTKNFTLVEYSNVLHIVSLEKSAIEDYVEYVAEAIPSISSVLHGAGYGADHLARAEAFFLRGDLNSAQTEAYKAVYKAEEKTQFDIVDNSFFLLIRILLATNGLDEIDNIIRQLEHNKEINGNRLYNVPDVAIGWFYSEIGEIDRVEEWIVYEGERSRAPISMDKDILLQIRCLIEKGEYPKALALTTKLQLLLEKRNMLISLMYVFVYRAVIQYSMDDYENATLTFKNAYNMVVENEIIMPFIEFGHKTRPLLGYLSKMGCEDIDSDWLTNVHTKASTYAKRRAYLASKYKIPASVQRDFGLSKREIELLKNLSQGLSREEIAESMDITINTVKSTTKTVYSKLGAINSSDAMRIAFENKIIN